MKSQYHYKTGYKIITVRCNSQQHCGKLTLWGHNEQCVHCRTVENNVAMFAERNPWCPNYVITNPNEGEISIITNAVFVQFVERCD